jgi:ribonuclease HII
MPDFSFENKLWKMDLIVAGIDEAGRGPLAGPVVAAAVIFKSDKVNLPKINDSKKINEKVRESLFDEILLQAESVGIGIVDNIEIDKINILQATFKAMHLSVNNLKIKPDHLIVDGNSFKSIGIDYDTIVKGDGKSVSIAAASIIAKVTRDRMMKEYAKEYSRYNFDKHKGYATKEHFEMIDKYGESPIHRKSFLKKYYSKTQNLFNFTD